MLNKENYVPWSSRILRYAKSRPNRKLIYNSIMNGPYVRRMIPELGDSYREVPVNETFHEQIDKELTENELKQVEADDQAMQSILLGLPEDIYATVDSCETAQKIWFTSVDGESIESYYHRFSKLMNDFKRNKHFPETIASNLKFLNNLQPEQSRHVTIVHQTKDLHTADYTQLYNFLKYNQRRQIAQPSMNMGQDRQMQIVRGNGRNQFRQYVGQNVGNQNRSVCSGLIVVHVLSNGARVFESESAVAGERGGDDGVRGKRGGDGGDGYGRGGEMKVRWLVNVVVMVVFGGGGSGGGWVGGGVGWRGSHDGGVVLGWRWRGSNTPGKSSYANVTGKPSGKKLNIRTLFTPEGNGIDVVVPVESIQTVSDQFANSAYGFFLGNRVAYPVVANYVKNTWGKYGLVRSMFSSSTGLFSFQFSSVEGLDAMLENGPWFIRNNPFILKKWHLDENLLKEDVRIVPVWVKLHGVLVTAFNDDGLSAIATKLGTPLMLDSYTTDMCLQSWGRSSYARVMIELRADLELKDNIVMAMPSIRGEGHYTCNVCVGYEWKPPRYSSCKVFRHIHDECPKNTCAGEKKTVKKPSQTSRGVLVAWYGGDECWVRIETMEMICLDGEDKGGGGGCMGNNIGCVCSFGMEGKVKRTRDENDYVVMGVRYDDDGVDMVAGGEWPEVGRKNSNGARDSGLLTPVCFRSLLMRAIEAGIFKGIKIGSSLNISHLFYADDAVFIGEWSIANLSEDPSQLASLQIATDIVRLDAAGGIYMDAPWFHMLIALIVSIHQIISKLKISGRILYLTLVERMMFA
ncbi:putative reverse transcriptase domain-containing protein [Tanacetum coccineum]